ncbi:MAG: DUF4332 domain-containing protein [Bacteroidales bacterium]
MYSTNLNNIKLDEFCKTLKTINLLPSHKILLPDIDINFSKLKSIGIATLADLQKLLKNKKRYSELSKRINIDTEYLTILNRVVNSYEVKSISIGKIEIFDESEILILKRNNLNSTKEYYDYFVKNQFIDGIDKNKSNYGLQIIDLLRINGVGLEFAKILYEIGIKSVSDFKNTEAEVILQKFRQFNESKKWTRSNLGLNDIEYCRRFCEKLDVEITF